MTFNWQDPLNFAKLLSNEEQVVMQKADHFCQQQLQPLVADAFDHQHLDRHILQKIATAGFFNHELSPVHYGLMSRALERVDSGFRTLQSVTCGLVMQAIASFGSDAQKQQYLPGLSNGTLVGCFGLTEPEHGSDPQNMQTHVVRCKQGFRLNGNKRWIGLAHMADVMVIWAKDETDTLRGLLVDKKTAGVHVDIIEGKYSLRTVPSGMIHLNDVVILESQLLPNAKGFKAPFSCLNHARYGIGWGALGAAERCYQIARDYICARNDFAAKQLVQQKLADMATEISLGLLSCLQVGRLMAQGLTTPEHISLIKRNSSTKALAIARSARDILGGNGILLDHDVIRHMLNLESVVTYEGTSDIHSLILGRAITDRVAF